MPAWMHAIHLQEPGKQSSFFFIYILNLMEAKENCLVLSEGGHRAGWYHRSHPVTTASLPAIYPKLPSQNCCGKKLISAQFPHHTLGAGTGMESFWALRGALAPGGLSMLIRSAKVVQTKAQSLAQPGCGVGRQIASGVAAYRMLLRDL